MNKDPLSTVVKFWGCSHCCHNPLFVPGVMKLNNHWHGMWTRRAKASMCVVNFDAGFTRGAVPQAERSRQPVLKKLKRALTLSAFLQIDNANVVAPVAVLQVIQAFGHELNLLLSFSQSPRKVGDPVLHI